MRPVPTRRCPPPVLVAALLASTLAGGCRSRLDAEYGAVRGSSINGISAFVRLLRDAGHSPTVREFLPESVEPQYDAVVVFDHEVAGLSAAAAERLLGMLESERPRTLLVVLRDSDCLVGYLDDMSARDDLTPAQRTLAGELLEFVRTQLAEMTADPRVASRPLPDALEPREERPATEAIDVLVRPAAGQASRHITARWPLARRLEPGRLARPLWETDGEPLLVRRSIDDDVVMVLASAAPLLNGGLVDPGNRALAEDLAGRLPADSRVLVLGSTRVPDEGGGGEGDPGDGDEEPSPWRLLAVQPLPWVLVQCLLAMGLFCWCTFPIFGRPRRTSPAHAQDFGHHVAALAGLVARGPASADAFCERRLAEWRQASPARAVRPRRRRH